MISYQEPSLDQAHDSRCGQGKKICKVQGWHLEGTAEMQLGSPEELGRDSATQLGLGKLRGGDTIPGLGSAFFSSEGVL